MMLVRRVALVVLILWLPLQGIAAVAMPFCAHGVGAQDAFTEQVGHSHHAHAHHPGAEAHPGQQPASTKHSDLGCNGCGPCHLACAPAVPVAMTLALGIRQISDLFPAVHDPRQAVHSRTAAASPQSLYLICTRNALSGSCPTVRALARPHGARSFAAVAFRHPIEDGALMSLLLAARRIGIVAHCLPRLALSLQPAPARRRRSIQTIIRPALPLPPRPSTAAANAEGLPVGCASHAVADRSDTSRDNHRRCTRRASDASGGRP